jgi:hypothetical protein
MRSMVFDDLFAILVKLPLRTDDLAQLRQWIASIAHPCECLALIGQAAGTPPCPHCACAAPASTAAAMPAACNAFGAAIAAAATTP